MHFRGYGQKLYGQIFDGEKLWKEGGGDFLFLFLVLLITGCVFVRISKWSVTMFVVRKLVMFKARLCHHCYLISESSLVKL